jgi:hypothetical protein
MEVPMPNPKRFDGSCHCGNIRLTFETETPSAEVGVRECGCSFCRKHGSRSVAEPTAKVAVRIGSPRAVTRYRFGLKTADFLVCRVCGVYAASLLETDDGRYATINLNVLDDASLFTNDAKPVSYDGETAEQREARRCRNWSKVVGVSSGK